MGDWGSWSCSGGRTFGISNVGLGGAREWSDLSARIVRRECRFGLGAGSPVAAAAWDQGHRAGSQPRERIRVKWKSSACHRLTAFTRFRPRTRNCLRPRLRKTALGNSARLGRSLWIVWAASVPRHCRQAAMIGARGPLRPAPAAASPRGPSPPGRDDPPRPSPRRAGSSTPRPEPGAARRKYTTRRCGRSTDASSVRLNHWSSRTDEASVLRVESFLRAA